MKLGILADLKLFLSLGRDIRKRLLELKPGDLAIDLGANVGRVSNLFRNLGCQVYAFEPDPLAFEVLLKRARRGRGIFPLPFAAGLQNKSAKLFTHREREKDPIQHTQGSSMMSGKPNVSSQSYDVAEIDFAQFLKQLGPVAALKIDIEGFEVDLVPHLIREGALENVDTVFIETHDHKWPELSVRSDEMRRIVEANQSGTRFFLNWV